MPMLKKLALGPVLAKLSYGSRIHAARDWFALLSVVIALLILSVLWNLWLLKGVEQGAVIGTATSTPAFDAAPIESARALFQARSEEERKYRQEYRFVDPSR